MFGSWNSGIAGRTRTFLDQRGNAVPWFCLQMQDRKKEFLPTFLLITTCRIYVPMNAIPSRTICLVVSNRNPISKLLVVDFINECWLQFPHSRPSATKEGEKKRLWRRVWEISHKFTGIIALLLAMINISLGLFLSVAPQIIWIAWFSFLGLLTITYIIAELCLRIKGNKIVVNETGHDNDVPMN